MNPARPRQRRRLLDWRALIGIGISVALLWWAFHEEDPAAIWAELKLADPLLFVLSAAAATGVFWIRAWRWKGILAAAAPETSFRSRFAAVSIGFMGNNLLPLRVGEFARVYALARLERVSMVASFGSLVIERLFDGIFVVLLLFVVIPGILIPLVLHLRPNWIGERWRGKRIAIGAVLVLIGGFMLRFIMLVGSETIEIPHTAARLTSTLPWP